MEICHYECYCHGTVAIWIWQCIYKQKKKQCITVKLGIKELLNKEQIGNSEPFPVTTLPVYFKKIVNKLALVNNFAITKKFLDAKFDCTFN